MITNLFIGYQGRLGNQMFQYASLISTAKRLNTNVILPSKNLQTKEDGCFDFSNNCWISYKLDLYNCFDISVPIGDVSKIKNVYKEPHFHYDPRFIEVMDNTSIEGYFQSYRYFEDVADDIKREFAFKPEIVKTSKSFINDIRKKNDFPIIGIHVRRGDTVINPNVPSFKVDYLISALNQFFVDREFNYLFISDDISWCRDTFEESETTFYSDKSVYEDLCIMTMCDHNISSNSSYGWWAAYLNPNVDKKVVIPKNWFMDKNINLKDLYYGDWNVI